MSGIPHLAHALSVREPWAWALTTGIKSVENRSWAFPAKRHPLPAWIAIHASLGWDGMLGQAEQLAAEYPSINVAIRETARMGPTGRAFFARSELIGAIQIVDCVAVPDLKADEPMPYDVGERVANAMDRPMSCRMTPDIKRLDWVAGDAFAWIVGDCYRFDRPIVCTGRLNVWAMPDALCVLANDELKRSAKAQRIGIEDRGAPFGRSVVYQLPKVSKKELAICG